jgi:hypothetical protein
MPGSAAQLFKFGFQLPQNRVDLHLAVELLFLGQPRLGLLDLTAFC